MIKLFWFSNPHLKRDDIVNFGDELSKDLIHKLSGKKVKWINPMRQNFFQKKFTNHVFGIGSILHFGAKNSLIWGSGLIDSKSIAPNAKYFAVRGKHTRNELLNRGYNVPEVYGDPGLLVSKVFPRKGKSRKFKIGVIPHYVEFDDVNNWYLTNNITDEIIMIDLRKDIQTILNQIINCEFIISSSLHGIIIPQSYDIPSLRVSFTNRIIGDGIKYNDYFDSVGIENYKYPFFNKENFTDININDYIHKLERKGRIKKDLLKIQDNLISVKPF